MLIPSEPKILFLLLIAFFLVLFFIALILPYSRTQVTVTGKNKTTITAEIADNPITQARGLMFREALPEGQGMIFIYGDEAPRSFWMKNTLIPLDLIFADSGGTVVDIKENFEPCESFECPRYVSKPAKYVLEVNGGFVKKHGIAKGGRMRTG
ncbi:MAG: DUF192 domain-containing protein [Candidatus Aenigmarchaeota archaeon]|nr:DUF192 domain-containing protein [Candidatus Aenigmarchaeota archaeon]